MARVWDRRELYLGLGSNLGNRLENLQKAFWALIDLEGVWSLESALIIESVAVVQGQARMDYPPFLNTVLAVSTDISPLELLGRTQAIEQSLGRDRSEFNRKLDIDLLWDTAGSFRADGLILPHPRLAERAFVLVPLGVLRPNLIIPSLGKVSEIMLKLSVQKLLSLSSWMDGGWENARQA